MVTDGGTPWLDADERRTWLSLAALVSRLPAALDAQLQADAGLTHYEYLVLAGLSEAPGRTCRMSELATFSNGSASRLSHVAGRLERRGYITRRADPEDGRATLATLTEAGWEKIEQVAPGHVTAVRAAVFDPLTRAQVRQLHAICNRIHQGLADLPAPCAGEVPPPVS